MVSRQRRYEWLIRAGFLPLEARQYSHIGKGGFQAPYVRRMVNSRRMLKLNAQKYDWSDREYRNAIKKLYIDRECIKRDAWGRAIIDVWKMLRWYEERYPLPPGEIYESPWRKRIQKQTGRTRVLKKATRKTMLTQWIKDLEKNIVRAEERGNTKRAKKLREQKSTLERQLRRLE